MFAVAFACGGGGQAAPKPPAAIPDAGGAALAALGFSVDPGLACANGQGICVAPSQVVTFGVKGLSGTVVSLSLEGSYADAALTAQTVTLAGGTALVALESASTTASFSIVARVGSAGSNQTVSLPVTVATSGSATIEATPVYTGHRPTNDYYATDFVLSTCAELTASGPDAGGATWTAGASGGAIALVVPAGERVAVQVRLGHYAFGCADVDPLVPQTVSALRVQVYDVPLALNLTNLDATFSYATDTTGEWLAMGRAAVARVEGAFFPTAGQDGPALLDAMRAAIVVPADQSQFDSLRATSGWDATAGTWMSAHLPSLNSRAGAWLTAAEGDGIGPLAMTIGNGTAAGTAPVTASGFGSLSWVAAGLLQPAPFQWTADANDTIHLAGAIDLASTPLLAHEADEHASDADAGASDVPSALALAIDCGGFATSLVGSGVSYGTCYAPCTANLCAAALAATWKSAAEPAPSGADVVHTTITASAPADVGDLAEPALLQGGWLGEISGPGVPPLPDGGSAFPVSGTLLAIEPPAP
jgi:hypothetical protein